MKSHFEFAEHREIIKQREKNKTAARLGEITGDKAVRILTNQLTRSERVARRVEAGIDKRPLPQKKSPTNIDTDQPHLLSKLGVILIEGSADIINFTRNPLQLAEEGYPYLKSGQIKTKKKISYNDAKKEIQETGRRLDVCIEIDGKIFRGFIVHHQGSYSFNTMGVAGFIKLDELDIPFQLYRTKDIFGKAGNYMTLRD